MIAWVLTAGIGVYMLRTWVIRGGLRRQRATGIGVPPAVVFGHASAALSGLLLWLVFLRTGWDPLAWLGVTLIAGAIALGICTVTLWTPYPVAVPAPPAAAPRPAAAEAAAAPDGFTVTDEMIAGLLAEPSPGSGGPRLKLAGLVPVAQRLRRADHVHARRAGRDRRPLGTLRPLSRPPGYPGAKQASASGSLGS